MHTLPVTMEQSLAANSRFEEMSPFLRVMSSSRSLAWK